MPQAAIAINVHQPLDVHLRFRTQRAFDFEVGGDDRADLRYLVVGQLGNLLGVADTRRVQNSVRARAADAIDVRQADFSSLVLGQINAGNTCHVLLSFLK